jgi:PAS domain-containing protein
LNELGNAKQPRQARMTPEPGSPIVTLWERIHRVLSRDGRFRRVVASIIAGLTLGLAIAAAELGGISSYSIIVIGVAGVTWYAGFRFALVVTAVAAALGWIFIAEPRGSLSIELSSLERLAIGIVAAIGVSYLLDRALRAERHAFHLLEARNTLVEEASEREAWIDTLTDALPVLISYVDADQRYRFNNREYESWFGQSREQIKGGPSRKSWGGSVRQYPFLLTMHWQEGRPSPLSYRDAGR